MNKHKGRYFTAIDRDNDATGSENCAESYNGGWWYNACHDANLNGAYGDNRYGKGINWRQWHTVEYSLSFSEMKIKPR